MSINHDYMAQQLYRERAARLRDEAAAARLARLATRPPRGRRVRRPWWHRLQGMGPTTRPRPA